MGTKSTNIQSKATSTDNPITLMGGVEKMPTGICGFDVILEGGIPKSRTLLISGSTGTGKTVFTNEFIYRGITEYKENGVYVTFEERPGDLIKNVINFGWDFDKFIKENKLAFVDASPENILTKVTGNYDLSSLIERIKYAVKKVNAKRVAIDALSMLFSRFKDKDIIRDTIFIICDELKSMGVTSIITAEKSDDESFIPRYGVEEYVVDGVVVLKFKTGQQQFIRELFVKKLRGTNYRSGTVEFEITNHGLEVFPKIQIDRRISKTDFKNREKLGIVGVDEAMGGGIPQGHTVLVSGSTGTGKTLLNMHFVTQGIREGKKTVYIALEEPVEQIRKTAKGFNFDFDKYEKEKQLIFISPSLIDLSNDKLLNDIVKAVNESGAKRVVIDSISSLKSATMDEEKVRQFLIQASFFFKNKGITTIMNYLSRNNFGAERNRNLAVLEVNMMRLSSVVDGIINLQYVERDQQIQRLFFVMKLRGSWHSNYIYQYEIDKEGIKLGKRFKE